MATVSEAARFLGVDRDKVKRWTKEFAEYLSLTAQPVKGKERQFSEADLRVLAVIAEHLELGNDADDVHYALNSGQHLEEPLLEVARLHSPLFQDPSDEMGALEATFDLDTVPIWVEALEPLSKRSDVSDKITAIFDTAYQADDYDSAWALANLWLVSARNAKNLSGIKTAAAKAMRPKRIRFTGLIGNRSIAELTHSELRSAFNRVGLREAHNGHAFKRLTNRGPRFGIQTLADFARRYNSGRESRDEEDGTTKLVLAGTRLAIIFNQDGHMITMAP